ncbi:MAG: energy-coupling factor transporter transmembrane protein EcfT [Actinobacteria bacterium]|nr:MAG: energy-coupling factor transporter transmembrane protein EcfT [Actinomycetota bacterium]
MRVPVAFGQYVPVESPVHALDPRTKMGLVAAFTFSLFLMHGLIGLALAGVLVAAVVRISRVPWRIALRGTKAVMLILIITLAAHALRWNPATVSLVRIGPLAVDGPGLLTGVFFAARIVLLVVGTSLLTLTTSPVALTDGLERLMHPLERVHFPASEVAMMLTIALRFIPTTAQEAEKILVAQTARGARFDEGGPIRRAKAFGPVLVPLFVNLFRRADDLATAMESRCYRGGIGRTRLHESVMRTADWAVLCLGSAALVALGLVL